jgi:hypothetical protein
MKVIQIETFGKPAEVLKAVDIPDVGAPAAGEVVIAVEASPMLSSLEPLNTLRRPQSLLVASAQVRPGSACRLQYCRAPFELDGQDRRHRSDVGLRRWRRD